MAASDWTDDFLNQMRGQTDPLADQAVRAVFETGAVKNVNHLLTQLVKNDQLPPSTLPAPIKEYLEKSAELPPWTDHEVLHEAQQLFNIWGLSSCAILVCASLPECYMMGNGVHVLAMTGQLDTHVRRRALETAQMVMDVMSPKALEPNGKGVRAAQRVRLLHASIRFLIQYEPTDVPTGPADSLATVAERESDWDPAWGLPINQEDLAFTLMTFSHVAIRSLDKLGVDMTDSQKDAYIHTWNVVAYLMGLREELLPANHREAEQLFTKIKQRQGFATPQGKEMEAALLAFLAEILPGPLSVLPTVMTRELVDAETADALGVEKINTLKTKALTWVVEEWRRVDKNLSKLYGHHGPIRFVAEWLNNRLMYGFGRLPRGWNRDLFQIPTELAAAQPEGWDGTLFSLPKVLSEKFRL